MAKPELTPATRIRASRLLGAIKDVIGAVATKDTISVLSHVMISALDYGIELTATDLDMQAVRWCASDDHDGPDSAEWLKSIMPFSLTVPGKALLAILGGFDGDAMVTLTVEGSRLAISAGRARFRLATLAAADLPVLTLRDMAHEFEIYAAVLGNAIDSVEHAISTEETRYYLNGIYVHPDGLNLHLATTDGHRLARLRIDAPDGAASWPPMIVPRGLVGELGKALAHAIKVAANPTVVVRTNAAGNLVSFTMPAADDGEIELISKTIDGTVPDYNRVIPHAAKRELTVGREALAGAVARVSALAHKATRLIRLDITEDRIDLTVANADLGDAREEVPARCEGDDQAIGFDGKYLRDVLGKIATDDVVIRWTDGEAPVRIEASGADKDQPDGLPRLVHVLMPVRV